MPRRLSGAGYNSSSRPAALAAKPAVHPARRLMPVSSSVPRIRFAAAAFAAACAGIGLVRAGLAAAAQATSSSTPPQGAPAPVAPPTAAATAAPATAATPLLGFSPAHAAEERALEARFDAALRREELAPWLKRLSARPHHLGSPYDKENADFIAGLYRSWGYDTRIEAFQLLYATPKERRLEMLAPRALTASLTGPPPPQHTPPAHTPQHLPPPH